MESFISYLIIDISRKLLNKYRWFLTRVRRGQGPFLRPRLPIELHESERARGRSTADISIPETFTAFTKRELSYPTNSRMDKNTKPAGKRKKPSGRSAMGSGKGGQPRGGKDKKKLPPYPEKEKEGQSMSSGSSTSEKLDSKSKLAPNDTDTQEDDALQLSNMGVEEVQPDSPDAEATTAVATTDE